ncbi:MAG: hypothetical protein QF473_18750 [Planctomycetota bacterium]|nr:hypothetical protein [Planctomycetota bacterium]
MRMSPILKVLNVFGKANIYLKKCFSTHATEKKFRWAVHEATRIMIPTTLRDAEEEAFDVVPNVGVPDQETLKKKLPSRVSQYSQYGSGVNVASGLSQEDVEKSIEKNLRKEDFRVHLITASDFTKTDIFRFFSVSRSEGGFITTDGHFSYHVISFRVYGRIDETTYYMVEGAGYRKDAF